MEENILKDNLDNKVTQTKEKLENFLSESYNIIKVNERINKGIKSMKKNDEKNFIKNLSYISRINKSKKELIRLIEEPMKNLKIVYDKDKSDIKYEEYNFNINPIPTNITFVYNGYWNVKWELDEQFTKENIDIKFKVEISAIDKENYIKVYEGNNSFCVLEFNNNTNYNFRICSLYNEMMTKWIEKKNLNPYDLFDTDSKILSSCVKKVYFIKQILEWSGFKKMELIYIGSRDGSSSESFHSKCDNQGPTIVLYKNNNEGIFGGFTSISWQSKENIVKDPSSFLFTLINIHNTKPEKFPCKKTARIKFSLNKGPCFGLYRDVISELYNISFDKDKCDISVGKNFYKDMCFSDFPCSYDDVLGLGYSVFTSNSNSKNFQILEIEVFKLFK